jgi:hypothetical protein
MAHRVHCPALLRSMAKDDTRQGMMSHGTIRRLNYGLEEAALFPSRGRTRPRSVVETVNYYFRIRDGSAESNRKRTRARNERAWFSFWEGLSLDSIFSAPAMRVNDRHP